MHRRQFVVSSTGAAAASLLPAGFFPSTTTATEPQGSEMDHASHFVPNRIAVSTYSFWRFRDDSKLTMSKCIDLAARMGFDGVELLRIQMEDDSDAYLQKLKRQAFVNGLDLIGMSTHQGFVTPDKDDSSAEY